MLFFGKLLKIILKQNV